MAGSRQFLRSKGTQPIGREAGSRDRVAFVTAPLVAPAESLASTQLLAQPAPAKPARHRRFDPALARRDGLARVREAIAARQAAIGATRRGGIGRAVQLRLVLELADLREVASVLAAFDGKELPVVARVEAANVLQELALLDVSAATHREDAFRLRQRLIAIEAGAIAQERIISAACMAIRALDDAVRRLLSVRREATTTVLDDHAALIEEQRVHALVAILHALGRAKLVGLTSGEAEVVLQTFRKVDPQAFGFDPRNQRFVRHMADLLERLGELRTTA